MKLLKRLSWLFFIILTLITIVFVYYASQRFSAYRAVKEEKDRQAAVIDSLLLDRQANANTSSTDPFGDDNIARILLVGIDSRAGQEYGHCDAIQLFEIDRAKEAVQITAVPRGTYSPLPPGTGTTSSDYYVSNSCALGGLDYGITNIERILGKQADYIVVVGFSETLGILRYVDLPTTKTLQWLRNRQGYAIGEPQRARNHSTFLKQLLVKMVPEDISKTDKALHYIVYTKVQSDLSFDQAEQLVAALVNMKIADHPEKITLAMKPAYSVQDIPYNPDTIDEHLSNTIGRVEGWLGADSFSGKSKEEIQTTLLETIEAQYNDLSFMTWAFENDLWLQIEDTEMRETIRWDMLTKYLETLDDTVTEEALLADYILEMQHLGDTIREQEATQYLLSEYHL